jgi:hypothetical protein
MAGAVTGLHVFAGDVGPEPLSLLDGNYGALTTALNTLTTFGNSYVDSGAVNGLVVTVPAPQVFAYTDGVILNVKVAATNTVGNPTINVNALGAKLIVYPDGTALAGGALIGGGWAVLQYEAGIAKFMLLGSIGAGLGVGRFADGSAPAPSITFASDLTLGLYKAGADILGFATSGISRGTINAAGNWNIPSPGSGTSLTVNAFGTTAAVVAMASDGQGQISLAPTTGAGSYAVVLSADSTGGKLNANSNSRDLQFQTNSISALKLTTAQVVQATDDGGTFQTVGWRDLPPNSQAGTYTLVLADRGKMIIANGNITIPPNASVAFPVGTTIVVACNAASITIAITSDTLTLAGTATTGTRTLVNAGLATMVKWFGTSWLISGPGLS